MHLPSEISFPIGGFSKWVKKINAGIVPETLSVELQVIWVCQEVIWSSKEMPAFSTYSQAFSDRVFIYLYPPCSRKDLKQP